MATTQYKRLRLTFMLPDAAESGDWIEIEQPEEEEVSLDGFEAWAIKNDKPLTTHNLPSNLASYRSFCEEDGCLTVEIRVHKSREDLPYNIMASYGELSEKYRHTREVKKSVLVENEDTIELNRLVDGDVSVKWEGDVFGEGGVITPPGVGYDVSSGQLQLDQKAVGSLRYAYTEIYDSYTLTITPRKAADLDSEQRDSAYESSVVVTWAGEPVTHSVDIPELEGSCVGGNSLHMADDEDEDDEKCYERVIKIDPCTKEVVSDELNQVACPERE